MVKYKIRINKLKKDEKLTSLSLKLSLPASLSVWPANLA